MSDDNMRPDSPNPDGPDERLTAAFGALRDDTANLDAMGPLNAIQAEKPSWWTRPGALAGVAAATLLFVAGAFVFQSRNDDQQVAADVDSSEGLVPTNGLTGTSWTLVSGTGPGGDVVLVADNPITIVFEDDQLNGRAACNSYGGSYSIQGDRITLGDIAQTLIGCVDAVAAAEASYMAALADVGQLDVSSDALTLVGPNSELIFTRNAPIPSAGLIGQLWLLDTLIQGETATSVQGENLTFLLDPNGTFAAGTGCRELAGDYIVNGNEVVFTSFEAIGECDPELQGQDGDIVSVFEGGFVPEIDGDRLTVTAPGGEGLSFRAVGDGEIIDDTSPDPGSQSLEEFLEGTTWKLLEGEGPGGPMLYQSAPSVSFAPGSISGRSPCDQGWGAEIIFEGEQVEILAIGSEEEGCDAEGSATDASENAWYAALADTSQVALEGNEDNILVFSGGASEMIFERVGANETDTDPGTIVTEPTPTSPPEATPTPAAIDEVLSVSQLLDQRPSTVVDVTGRRISYGDTTILCDDADSDPVDETRCNARWVTVTNYNDLVDNEGPLNGVLRDDGRFQIIGPGSGVAERESGVELTDDELAMLDWFLLGFFDGPTLAEQSDPRIGPDGITLWLGPTSSQSLTVAEMGDRSAWTFEQTDYEGFAGPFHIYDQLEVSDGSVSFNAGPHDHCAGQPRVLPDDLAGLRLLSIQPTGIDSCIQWFAIDLFVNGQGELEAVMLDLFGP